MEFEWNFLNSSSLGSSSPQSSSICFPFLTQERRWISRTRWPKSCKACYQQRDSLHIWKRGEMSTRGRASETGDWNNCLLSGGRMLQRKLQYQRGNICLLSRLECVFKLGDPLHLSSQVKTKWSLRRSEENIHVNLLFFGCLNPNNHWQLIATGREIHCMLCSQRWSRHKGKETHLFEMLRMHKPEIHILWIISRDSMGSPISIYIYIYICIYLWTTHLHAIAKASWWWNSVQFLHIILSPPT